MDGLAGVDAHGDGNKTMKCAGLKHYYEVKDGRIASACSCGKKRRKTL